MSQGIGLCFQQHGLFLLAIDLVDDAYINEMIHARVTTTTGFDNMRNLPIPYVVMYKPCYTPVYRSPSRKTTTFPATKALIGANYHTV